jgi:hypothetical protein
VYQSTTPVLTHPEILLPVAVACIPNFKVSMLLNSASVRGHACTLDMQLMQATEILQNDCSSALRMATIKPLVAKRTKSATAGDCIYTCHKKTS